MLVEKPVSLTASAAKVTVNPAVVVFRLLDLHRARRRIGMGSLHELRLYVRLVGPPPRSAQRLRAGADKVWAYSNSSVPGEAVNPPLLGWFPPRVCLT